MQRRLAYASLLLLTSQLVAPALLRRRRAGDTSSGADQHHRDHPTGRHSTEPDPDGQDGQAAEEPVEISAPGMDATAGNEIVVVGRNIPNTIRATPQIVSVLSAADIARTGEGDIAGALTRVTGLSVVGGGSSMSGSRRPLLLVAAQRLALAQPRAAAPFGSARHLPDHHRRLGAGPEDLFGQLSRRVRRRRHQPDDQGDPGEELHLGRLHRRGRRCDDQRAGLYLCGRQGRLAGLRRRHARRAAVRSRRAGGQGLGIVPAARWPGCPTPRPPCSSATTNCPPICRASCRRVRCSTSAATAWRDLVAQPVQHLPHRARRSSRTRCRRTARSATISARC